MNQTFNTVFEFYKCTVISDVGYFSGVNFTDFVFVGNVLPWVGFKLFHTQRNSLVVFVELDNLNFNSLADRQNFCRMIDAFPRNVGNVQQAVNTAEVNKCTVIGNVFNHALENGTFFQVID